jgi:hypothetical protein
MRAPTDMPRRPPRPPSRRGRTFLVAGIVLLFLLLTSLRGIAGFYTDYLWFDSLGRNSVFSGVLGAKLALAAIFTGAFFVLLWVNLVIADRMAPPFRPAGPDEEFLQRYHEVVDPRAGWVRAGVSVLLALIAGAGVSTEWESWILFTNGGDFGIDDPQFGTDLGFYVFKLPFLSFVSGWLFAALLIVLIVTAVAHYLNGGIRVGSVGQRVTPQVKAHLSVLLGLLALVKAGGYWLQRYDLATSTRGYVDGAPGCRRGRRHLPAVRAALPGDAERAGEGAALHRAQHRGDAGRDRAERRRARGDVLRPQHGQGHDRPHRQRGLGPQHPHLGPGRRHPRPDLPAAAAHP